MTSHEIARELMVLQDRLRDHKNQVDPAKTQLGIWELVHQVAMINEQLQKLVGLVVDNVKRKTNG